MLVVVSKKELLRINWIDYFVKNIFGAVRVVKFFDSHIKSLFRYQLKPSQ